MIFALPPPLLPTPFSQVVFFPLTFFLFKYHVFPRTPPFLILPTEGLIAENIADRTHPSLVRECLWYIMETAVQVELESEESPKLQLLLEKNLLAHND